MDNMNKKGRPTISDEWGSFIAIPSSFVKASKPLTDKARWLFVLLREYTNGESGVAFPSYDTIRERTGWGRSQISGAIKCLETHGWLSRQHQFGGVTLYRLVKPVEPNSTEPKLLEAPKTAIANNPKPRRQKSQTETPIVPNRDAIKIETTKIEINKIDICESQVGPFDSLANGDDESVHAQPCRRDLNGSCVNHPYTLEGCTEPSKLYRLQAEKDWQAKQAALTVHANGGSATPPEVAPAPPTQPQTDHQRMMAALDRVSGGRKILNGAAQGKAIKKILTGYTADQAIECLEWMADPQSWWKGNIDWLSVQNQILSYLNRKEQQPQTKLGGLNTNEKSKLWEFCNSQPLGQF